MLRKAMRLTAKAQRYGMWLQLGLLAATFVAKKVNEKKVRRAEMPSSDPDFP